eukprot:243091_1
MGSVCQCLPMDEDPNPTQQSGVVNFEFAAIADQDKQSKISSDEWISFLQFGRITYDTNDNKVLSIGFCKPSIIINDDEFKGGFDKETDAVIIQTNIGTEKKKRGAEFSAMCLDKDNNKVLVGDDKTGIIYELDSHFNLSVRGKAIQNKETGQLTYITSDELTKQNIDDKGYKIEWMTYKSPDGLYFGSNSTEWTDFKSQKVTPGNSWVGQMGKKEVKTMDWTDKYNAMRSAVGAVFPGWMNIECIIWSDVHKSWFVLPRYLCVTAGFDSSFASYGCHVLLIVSEDGKDVRYVHIKLSKAETDEVISIDDAKEDAEHDFDGAKKLAVVTSDDLDKGELQGIKKDVAKSLFYAKNGAKGFSCARFVPGTKDKVILAVRTLETEKGMSSSLCVFDIDGTVFMEEYDFKGNRKYEGLIVFEPSSSKYKRRS